MKPSTGIHLTFRQLTAFLIVLLLLNLLVLLGTAIAHEFSSVPKGPASKFVLNQLNLATENVAAVWYSSMLLFLVAIAALICFFCERQQKSGWFSSLLNTGWLVLALIFLTLSLDEMGSFHELIGDTELFRTFGFGEAQGWNTFFMLIILVALFMITFFISKFKTSRRSFIFITIGTLLYLSNPFQEEIEITAFRSAADPASWRRPIALLLLEEGSEIFGTLCFLSAMTLYAVDRSRQLQLSRTGIDLHLHSTRRMLTFLSFSFLLGFALMLFLYLNGHYMVKGDDGIAENWFPGAAFFVIVLTALYNTSCRIRENEKFGFGLLALMALLHSVYFGSNSYASALLHQPVFLGVTPHFSFVALSTVTGFLLLYLFKEKRSRIFITMYLLLTILQASTLFIPAPFAGYLSAILLLSAALFQAVSASVKSAVAAPTVTDSATYA